MSLTPFKVGEEDKLCRDSVELAEKLKENGSDCILHKVPHAGHGWDCFVKEGTALWLEREKALNLTVNRLRDVYQS